MRSLLLLFSVLLAGESFARLPDLIPYRKGNLWGYCDSTKKIVLQPQWEAAHLFYFGRAVVYQHGKAGIIDSLGHYVITPQYYSMYVIGRTRFGAEIDEDHAGVIDDSGNVVIPFIARWVSQESDSVLCIPLKGDKAMVCDLNGKLILHGDYLGWDFGVGNASHLGLFIMMQRSDLSFWDSEPKMIVVDTADRQLFPGKYDWIELIDDSLFECKLGDSVCYYTIQGKLHIIEEWPSIKERLAQREREAYVAPAPELFWKWSYVLDKRGNQEQVLMGYKDQHGTEYWND